MQVLLRTLLAFVVMLPCSNLFAQLSQGGQPLAASGHFKALPSNEVLPPLDMEFIRARDKQDEENGALRKFGQFIFTDISPATHGEWTSLPDGSRVWRMAVTSPGALGLSLRFDRFHLPEGAKLFAYRPDLKEVRGAFTNWNNRSSGSFAMGIIRGSTVILEYTEPANVAGKFELHLNRVGHAYRDIRPMKQTRAFGDSDTCQVNVHCPEGDNWQDQIKSAVGIEIDTGFFMSWCSGVLMNNTNQDYTPYILSAEHCGQSLFGGLYPASIFENWVFYFDFEAPGCNNPQSDNGLYNKAITGAVVRCNSDDGGGNSGSDMLLMELMDTIPANWGQFYAGWNAENLGSSSGVSVHHPSGDIKKISTYTTPLVSESWGDVTPDTHWQVFWSATQSGHGVTEGGSSGSPIFDANGHVIGNLTGGSSFCDATGDPDEYGKLSFHWDQNGTTPERQLMHWLDPSGTNQTIFDGTYQLITSREEVENDLPPALSVYPNPSSGLLNIALPSSYAGEGKAQLQDVTGREVFASPLSFTGGKAQLDARGLPNGIYILQVQANGERSHWKMQISR